MKIYQCIHKYSPHIPSFEEYYNIKEKDLSFNELRNLLIQDGYASTYILKAPLIDDKNEIFYTIWNYERLQYKWAEEQDLKTRNLKEIKLAQVEDFQPDVFYNHSPRYDNNFVKELPGNQNIKKICWDAIITELPWLHEGYDARVTLFEPFVRYWRSKGLAASLLSPAYVESWSAFSRKHREIDVLFYGQYFEGYFSKRNRMFEQLLEWQLRKPYRVQIHLQYRKKRLALIQKRGLRRLTRWRKYPPKIVRQHALSPVYSRELYETIGNAKIVINAFTDQNGLFKDNMRTYEAIGGGALMISEDGIYPDFLIPDENFLTYENADELIEKIEFVLTLPDQGRAMAEMASEKLRQHCSKQRQWETFCALVQKL